MSNALSYCLNTPTVACEVIDGEAILIHFEKGCYYSTDGEGAFLVRGIAEGTPLATLEADLAARSNAPAESISSVVKTYLARLLEEDIIRQSGGESGEVNMSPADPSGSVSVESLGFDLPTLEKFTDLQDLLLLDPIHDVDEAGWPMANPQAEMVDTTPNGQG